MANITKYTGESLAGRIGNLADCAHLSYSYFKVSAADIIAHLGTTYTAFGPTGFDNLINTLDSKSSETLTVTGYPVWRNANKGNTVTNTVEVRQSTTFNKAVTADVWVGQAATLSYTITNNPYDKSVGISVSAGALTATTKAASSSATSTTSVALKKGTASVSFTPTTAKGTNGGGTLEVNVHQPITAINVSTETITVNSGGTAQLKVAVSATNTNDASATNNIERAVLFHTFTGSASGSTSTSASLTVAKNATPTTAFSLTNVRTGGTLKFAALAGSSTTANAGIPTGSTLEKLVTITVATLTIKAYGDPGKETTNINPGDEFIIQVTGGTGSGTISTNVAGATIENTTIIASLGTTIITVPETTTATSITVTFTPDNGSAVTRTINITKPTLVLS